MRVSMGSQQTVGKVERKVDNVKAKEVERRKKQRQIGQVERAKSNQVCMPSGSVCPTWPNLLLIFLIILPKVLSLICVHITWLPITLFLTGQPVNMTFYSPFAQMAN